MNRPCASDDPPSPSTPQAPPGTPPEIVAAELEQMQQSRIAPTANRSVVGIINEFTRLADIGRHHQPDPDLLDLSLPLAHHTLRPAVSPQHQPRP